jgi:hypothetical protein
MPQKYCLFFVVLAQPNIFRSALKPDDIYIKPFEKEKRKRQNVLRGVPFSTFHCAIPTSKG